jgi:hypothetical protein
MNYLIWSFVILLIGSITTVTVVKKEQQESCIIHGKTKDAPKNLTYFPHYSIATREIVHYIIEEILPNIENRQRILDEDFDFIERQVNKEIERKLKLRGK